VSSEAGNSVVEPIFIIFTSRKAIFQAEFSQNQWRSGRKKLYMYEFFNGVRKSKLPGNQKEQISKIPETLQGSDKSLVIVTLALAA
jgi:hypothetical protein